MQSVLAKRKQIILALAATVAQVIVAAQAAAPAPPPGAPPAPGAAPAAPPPPMTFFITSKGPGKGGNLGGLSGADAHCQALAASAGRGDRVWQAYLSTQATNSAPAVNARDRIGNGPWHNAKGQIIAQSVADLHGDFVRDRNQINKAFALDEAGKEINGRGDTPNKHDILTGSQSDGRAWSAGQDRSCGNWSSEGPGSATVGHHDRMGGGNSSWNQTHNSRSCSQPDLIATGGDGLFYCFAIN